MSSVDHEYYEYLMSQDKSDLAIEIMNLETSSSNNRIAEFIKEKEELKQQLHDLPKKIMEEIKGKQPNFTENSYGFTTKQGWDICVEILDTILKKYGGEDE